MISSLNSEQLDTHIKDRTLDTLVEEQVSLKDSDLTEKIQQCLLGFEKQYPNSDRNHQQATAAQQLAELTSVGVLNGPAGCGKTKIALEWAAKTNTKKIIWVCPRVQVCQGLINDLTSSEYLPDAKIEINTGEFKFIYQSGNKTETPEGKEFSGDVVITTIDQITNAIITHRSVTSLVDYMNAHVVFDEYHEYINMASFNLLFAELVQCKKFQEEKAKALLVSATPNYYFTEEFLGIDRDDIIGIDSFNQSKYKIQFTPFDEANQDETNPLYQAQPDNTIIISNTAQTAQRSFINNQENESALIFHSKYKKKDKDELFNKIVSTFKKGGSKEYTILRSGPVVQASLNITCDQMVTEFTHAENWLQRLGRLDRFGENDEENKYITAIPETLVNGKQSGACARFLNSLNSLQSAKAWYEFVSDKQLEETVTITQVYQLYKEFYDNDTHRKAIEEDFKTALKKSVEMIDLKLIDPVSLPRKKKVKDEKVKIKKHSLRGDNRFVQMAICNISSTTDIEFPNQYAYSEEDLEANLTAPVEVICGYGDSQQDLLGFMVKKHHNIKEVKKSYKDSFTLNEARNPETPIYLSYTPDDLKLVEGQPHPNAIYYAIGKKQPIGAISIKKLTEG